MEEARAAIESTGPPLKTYKEEWCDGLWIKPYDECRGVSRDPMCDNPLKFRTDCPSVNTLK